VLRELHDLWIATVAIRRPSKGPQWLPLTRFEQVSSSLWVGSRRPHLLQRRSRVGQRAAALGAEPGRGPHGASLAHGLLARGVIQAKNNVTHMPDTSPRAAPER